MSTNATLSFGWSYLQINGYIQFILYSITTLCFVQLALFRQLMLLMSLGEGINARASTGVVSVSRFERTWCEPAYWLHTPQETTHYCNRHAETNAPSQWQSTKTLIPHYFFFARLCGLFPCLHLLISSLLRFITLRWWICFSSNIVIFSSKHRLHIPDFLMEVLDFRTISHLM